MSYQAKRNGEYSSKEEIDSAKNANNIRNAANVAIATKNPYAAAAGATVKAADALTSGKASEGLGKALSKANQIAPGGQNLQDALNNLNDSGISDKIGDAAFASHKYNDYINQTQPEHEKKVNGQRPSARNFNELDNSDYNGEGENEAKGSGFAKTIVAISALMFAPIIIVFFVIIAAVSTENNFEDAFGSSYINGETIGGYVEIPKSEKEANEFYERILKVREKLAQKGMEFESVKIVAVYNIINNENNNFTHKKMTESKIEEIAELMFRKEKNEDGEIIYIYDEELFKENLKNKIYRQHFLLYSDKRRAELAEDTIKYINDYYEYIGEIPNKGSNVSSGEYTNWKQYTGPWTGVQLGNSGKNISQIGCAATSVSILIAKSGVSTTVSPLNPGTFVEKLSQNGGFGSGACLGCINWGKASTVAPAFRYVDRKYVLGFTKNEKLNTLSELLNQGYYVVAEVKGNTGEHWVAIDRIEGNNIIMIDPGSTSTNLWQTYNWKNTSTYIYYRVV